MAPVVPVMEAFPVSFAVMVWLPAVFNLAEKVPLPLVRGEFKGSFAILSVLLK